MTGLETSFRVPPAGPTVLLVDDDEQLLRVLTQVLARAGYVVMTARHGRAALAQLARQQVDLVVCDIFMPECDGLEVLGLLSQRPVRPRILAISGQGSYAMPDMLAVAGKLGADRVLDKPFQLENLLTVVRELVPRPAETPDPAGR